MQALNVLSAQLVDTRILKILDKINPDRDINTVIVSSTKGLDSRLGYEDYKETEDGTQYYKALENQYNILSLEEDTSASTSVGKKIDVVENLPFAVGKIFEAKFKVPSSDKSGFFDFSVPIVVSLDTVVVPSDTVSYTLTYNEEETRFSERLSKAWSGRIRFIKDFLLASDLIKEQKKAMIKDTTGVFNQILKRVNKSRFYSLLTGNFSLSEISAIFVITDAEENEIRKHFGSDLTSTIVRKKVFDNTLAMMIVVIDKEWEQVSIYVKDQDGYSQHSFNEFKSSSGKGSEDITELLKTFLIGGAVRF